MTKTSNPVALALQVAGTQQRLADALKVSRPSISVWLKKGEFPLKHLKEVSRLTQIPARDLMSREQKALMGA